MKKRLRDDEININNDIEYYDYIIFIIENENIFLDIKFAILRDILLNNLVRESII
jgi:hypothetical protein